MRSLYTLIAISCSTSGTTVSTMISNASMAFPFGVWYTTQTRRQVAHQPSAIIPAMPRPDIVFFTELGPLALAELFDTPGLVDELAGGGYGVSLAILDFSAQRAAVARNLKHRGVRVVAWLLLP